MTIGEFLKSQLFAVFSNVLDEIGDNIRSSAHKALTGKDYPTEDEHDSSAEPSPFDDEFDPDESMQQRVTDIPLHFNARPGEYDE